MAKDEFGYEYLRRPDGGAYIIAAWACAVAAAICAVIGAFVPSLDLTLLAGALGSLWGIFFITGNVVRAIYFVAGEAEKPRSRSEKNSRWRPDEGYHRADI